jgi:hypothetical protein
MWSGLKMHYKSTMTVEFDQDDTSSHWEVIRLVMCQVNQDKIRPMKNQPTKCLSRLGN